MRPWIVVATIAGLGAAFVAGAALLAFYRPPQPLALGAKQYQYETTYTVTAVERRKRLGRLQARGEYYIVDVLIGAPFGYRPTWDDANAEVHTFAGTGRTQPPGRFTVDRTAQAYMDQLTGRPRSPHEIKGASMHERLVFDLPLDVEQPGLVFLDANDPVNFLNILFGQIWEPHRYNLRYD